MWIILLLVALLIIGNLSKKSASHPLNRIVINPVIPVDPTLPTGGDNFNSGTTIIAGMPEFCTPILGPNASTSPCHIGAHFPVDPPPISIQRPIVPRPVCTPVLPVDIHTVTRPPTTFVPIRPVSTPRIYLNQAPVWCGNGPGWCNAKLSRLANNPGCRGMGSGCGVF